LIQLEIEISTHDAQINLPDSGSFPPCFGYRAWVDEVWVNYISNAIKYGGRPPVITFSGEQLDNGFARYWIKDNGEGIPPEQQNKLFVPFRRLSQTSQHSGHGLGLAIVLQIIEKLGGEVGLESTPGDGSTFWFTLPTQAPDV
jgi:two-component system sensor histidine kinase/response regulator